MKKLLVLLLTLVMVFSLAACGSTGSGEDDTVSAGASDAESVDMPAYKIGVICHTNSGGCWDRIFDAATYIGENLNCQVASEIGGTADGVLTAAENFIAAGYDGLILLADGGVTSRLIDMCSEAGVYIAFSGCNLTVTQEEGYAEFSKNPYYCGNYAHDEATDAKRCIDMMVDNGGKNFVVYGLAPGISANFDLRATAAEEEIEAKGFTYHEVRSNNVSTLSSTIMSQYPETDAVFSFITTPDSFNVEDFAKDYPDVQVSGYMCGDVTHEFEIGFMDYVCVGEEAQIEMSFAALYNALRGNRLQSDDGTAPVVEFSHLWLDNTDDYKTFISNVTGGNHAYTFDEVKNWIFAFNENVNIDDYSKAAAAFSAVGEGSWLESHK